jgi:hypothetical protein
MINKRLLIRNLLNHNDENSFYDNKLKIDLDSKEGKAKFLKHICALSNSNPENNSYIVIGVEDETNKIIGVDFFDDSRIQDLVNSCLVNPPVIKYENISFPRLQRHKVIGLVTVMPTKVLSSLKKNFWKYNKGMAFFRKGSASTPTNDGFVLRSNNQELVEQLEKSSSDTIELTLNGVFDFIQQHPKKYKPTYLVFKEYFVLCWAGEKKIIDGEIYYSRVDIELVKEQIRLFYSDLDIVSIQISKDSFIITEYVYLGILKELKKYPLEKTIIHFNESGTYKIATEFLFQIPKFDKQNLQDVYLQNNKVLEKVHAGKELTPFETEVFQDFPITYLICSLNSFVEAKEKLQSSRRNLKALDDKKSYIQYKEAMRLLRKVKYQLGNKN